MARQFSAILAALATIVIAPYAFACDCSDAPEDTDVVFFGEVSRVNAGATDTASMDVAHILEGHVTRRVEVATPGSPEECGVEFRRGQRYFVYADREDGTLTTNRCLGTKQHMDIFSKSGKLRSSGVSDRQIAQLKQLQALSGHSVGTDDEAEPRFDTSPPRANLQDEDSPPSLEVLGAALERPNALRPAREGRDLADKYLPFVYRDTPDADKYADDVYRVLESFYESGDCRSLETNAPRLDDYTGPYRIQVYRWLSHCALLGGDFERAQAMSEKLEPEVGFDAATDEMLGALAGFGQKKATPDADAGSFEEHLRGTSEIKFASRAQRMHAMGALADLIAGTQLIRWPLALEATADVVAALPDSENARRARALAFLRAAKLVDDEARAKRYRDRAREALADAPDVLETMRSFVEKEVPNQAPAMTSPWVYEPEPMPDNVPKKAAKSPPRAPKKAPSPPEREPETAEDKGPPFNPEWFILGGVALALVSLVLGLMSYFAKDDD
jgi:hypothetical protein